MDSEDTLLKVFGTLAILSLGFRDLYRYLQESFDTACSVKFQPLFSTPFPVHVHLHPNSGKLIRYNDQTMCRTNERSGLHLWHNKIFPSTVSRLTLKTIKALPTNTTALSPCVKLSQLEPNYSPQNITENKTMQP